MLLKNTGVLLNNLDSICRPVEIARPVFGQRTISMPIVNSYLLNLGGGIAAVVGRKDKGPMTIRWLC